MKRGKLCLVLLLLGVLLTCPARAAEAQFNNMMALANNWTANGYPDWVGGVYSPDGSAGHYGVLIVAGSEMTEADLRAMLRGDLDLREVITDCPHSYNEMLAIQREITAAGLGRKSNPPGIIGCAVGWTWDEQGLHGYGPSGREFRVQVTLQPRTYERTRAILLERYGEDLFDFRMGREPYRNKIAIGAGVYLALVAVIAVVGKRHRPSPPPPPPV